MTTCGICLEIINSTNKTVTNCNHTFHATCLFELVTHPTHPSNQCPMCRNQLVETKKLTVPESPPSTPLPPTLDFNPEYDPFQPIQENRFDHIIDNLFQAIVLDRNNSNNTHTQSFITSLINNNPFVPLEDDLHLLTETLNEDLNEGLQFNN